MIKLKKILLKEDAWKNAKQNQVLSLFRLTLSVNNVFHSKDHCSRSLFKVLNGKLLPHLKGVVTINLEEKKLIKNQSVFL